MLLQARRRNLIGIRLNLIFFKKIILNYRHSHQMKNNLITEQQLRQSVRINHYDITTSQDLENSKKEGSDQQLNECKVCLISKQTKDNPFISPCKCIGSMQFIHQQCLQKSIEMKLQKSLPESRGQTEVICEICKDKMKLTLLIKSQYVPFQTILQNIKKEPSVFLICMLQLLVTLLLLYFTLQKLSSQIQQGYDSVDSLQKTVILVCIPILSLLSLYFIAQLRSFCMAKRLKLKR